MALLGTCSVPVFSPDAQYTFSARVQFFTRAADGLKRAWLLVTGSSPARRTPHRLARPAIRPPFAYGSLRSESRCSPLQTISCTTLLHCRITELICSVAWQRDDLMP